jgi:L-ascorbate metabolism protein UlaG (beta-lactamase superfamily)
MLRHLTALLAALALAALAPAQEGKKLSIRWHGQSFFEIRSSKDTRIVIDPHAIENFGPKSVKADLILATHLHTDHTQFHVVDGFQKVKTLVGLKGDLRRATWNPIDEKFKDVHVQSVGTYHDDTGGMRRGLNSVMIIEVDGFRIVHLGDLGHLLTDAQVKAIGQPDILMVPVGGVYTLNGSDAKKVVEQLKPRHTILPMHYAIPNVYEDLLSAEEFLDEQKNVKKIAKNELLLDVEARPPEAPSIVLLHWSDR